MRESTQSWYELLIRVRDTQGLTSAPRLAIGDGALGFWKSEGLARHRGQRCWVHKTANVLNRLPKSTQAKVKSALQAIWMAPSRELATQAFEAFATAWGDKYPKAVETLGKDHEALLAVHDFPASHWQSTRSTNPIQSTFATERCRIATVVRVPLTSNLRCADAPGNVRLTTRQSGLVKQSVANVSQVVALDRSVFVERVGRLPPAQLRLIPQGIDVVLGR